MSVSYPLLSTNHTKSLLELAAIFTTSITTSDSSPVPYNDHIIDEGIVLSHPILPIENDIVDSVNPPSSEIVVTNDFLKMNDPPPHNDYLPRVA